MWKNSGDHGVWEKSLSQQMPESLFPAIVNNIYIFIHHNMTESTEQKEQQKST